MPEILTLLSCLTFHLNSTSLKHLGGIIQAMLAMNGRVTMLGISRWAGKGGSYRTIQRFFYSPKNWPTLMWVFFRTHCFCPQEKYAIAGDEVVTTKSGKKTYGVDWFFSSLASRPVKGLAFFALSLVGLEQRQSYPLRIEQVIRPEPEAKAAPPNSSLRTKGQRGRPFGSQNKAFFMVNISRRLLRDFRRDHHPQFSILDLKACYRAFKYVDEVIKLLPQKPEPILISRILNQVANLGAIHSVPVTGISPE